MWDYLAFTHYSYYRDFFCLGQSLSPCNHHRHVWVCYINTTKITVWCMLLLLLSIDLWLFCYFIMIYFKLTNGAMVRWWMVKRCNDEIKINMDPIVSHKYWIYSLLLFSNTTFLQQTKQSITFNYFSLTRSTTTKFILSKQSTTERLDFIRGQPIVVREIVTLIEIVWIQQYMAIHYCNHPVLAIFPDLNVTYSVLRLLIPFWEALWYGLFYYVRAIFTTGRVQIYLTISRSSPYTKY